MTSVTSLLDGRGFSDADRREHLETIRQEADRLHRVVNNLLDVARLRAGGLVPAKAPTAIDELMEGVLNRLAPCSATGPSIYESTTRCPRCRWMWCRSIRCSRT
jgi:K+-sensing histidine kinase KdpD